MKKLIIAITLAFNLCATASHAQYYAPANNGVPQVNHYYSPNPLPAPMPFVPINTIQIQTSPPPTMLVPIGNGAYQVMSPGQRNVTCGSVIACR